MSVLPTEYSLETLSSEPDLPEDIRTFVDETFAKELFPAILLRQKRAQALQARGARQPDETVSCVRSLHRSNVFMSGELMDALLQISRPVNDIAEDQDAKHAQKYGKGEQYIYDGTHYHFLRTLHRILPLSDSDVLMDLGAGLGRVVLYSGMVSPAKVIGIELVEERAAIAENAARHFDLGNVEIWKGNVLDHDLSEGNFFFLYSPFSTETLEKVMERLEDLSQKKRIRIAFWGPRIPLLKNRPRLRQILQIEGKLSVFEAG